jgi:hypothetical protein
MRRSAFTLIRPDIYRHHHLNSRKWMISTCRFNICVACWQYSNSDRRASTSMLQQEICYGVLGRSTSQMLIAFAAQSTARHTVQKFSKALENILIVLRALFVNFTKTGSGIAATFSASAIFAPHYGYSSCPNVTKRFQIRHTVSGVPCNDRRTQVGFLGLRESCCGRSCPEATSKNMSKRMCS